MISPTDHRTLFQNIEEILRLAEDILEQIMIDNHEPQLLFAARVYLSKSTAFCAAYKKYCNGLKRADCVLVSSIIDCFVGADVNISTDINSLYRSDYTKQIFATNTKCSTIAVYS